MKIEDCTLFFELLRVSVGEADALSREVSGKDWSLLFAMAAKQSLDGICFAGVEKLSESSDFEIPEETLYEWYGNYAYIKGQNDLFDRRCVELCQMVAESGLQSCILKGQGNAAMYGGQLRYSRRPGDIDLWISGGRQVVLDWVRSVAAVRDIDNHHVRAEIFPDCEVEVHYQPGVLLNRCADARYRKWYESRIAEQFTGIYPSASFNLVYQLTHLHGHFFTEGIGLRQFMDYYFLLKNRDFDDSQSREARKTVSRLGMDRFASAVMWVLGYVFGLSRDYMLWKPDGSCGRFVLEEIMKGGNFGMYDSSRRRKAGASHLYRFGQIVRHGLRFARHFPSMCLWVPLNHICTYLGNGERERLRKG